MKLNKAKKIMLGMLLIIAAGKAIAQQDAMFSQYMVNHFVINPAYAGSRDAFSTFLINRNQWIDIPGAPKTSALSLNTPVSRTMGVGLQFIADQIGPKNSIGYLASYSYKIKFNNKSNLAFGLRVGGFTYRFDWSKVEYKDQTDMYANQGVLQETAFNADFGIFYYTKKFYAGFAMNHLANTLRVSQINIGAGNERYLIPHSFLAAGYTFEINQNIAIQPSFLLRQTDNAPVNPDINCNVMFNKRFWLGVSYRANNAMVFLAQLYATDRFRFGYGYDLGVNKIGRVGRGAHEIFLGYDFSTKRYRTYSPRYF
jgi:type IX secretion system PorP/SprF family membrane protein